MKYVFFADDYSWINTVVDVHNKFKKLKVNDIIKHHVDHITTYMRITHIDDVRNYKGDCSTEMGCVYVDACIEGNRCEVCHIAYDYFVYGEHIEPKYNYVTGTSFSGDWVRENINNKELLCNMN